MCPDNKNEQTIGDSWTDIWEPVSHFLNGFPRFYGVIVVISGDVVNSIFYITMMIFVKDLSRDLCDGL